MSKYVKDLVARDIAKRLSGVDEALLVNVVGLNANQSVALRRQLREKKINLLVVKSSLARRATEGTPLGRALESAEGSLAVIWGSDDMISLAKEVSRLQDDPQFPHFQARGGVMEGERLSPQRVKEISKWPSRAEQLSILSAQLLSPGANLLAAILGPGARLAGQVAQKAKNEHASEANNGDGGGQAG